MIKPTLAVMAAGLGSRYGGLKQIDPVCGGHILLEYAIYDAMMTGFEKVAILIRHDFEDEFKNKYGKRIEEGVKKMGGEVKYVYQPKLEDLDPNLNFREKMGGTGHAALCFSEVVGEPFALINADDFYGRETFQVIVDFFSSKNYNPQGSEQAIVAFKLKNVVSPSGPVTRGICEFTSDNNLSSIIERREIVLGEDDRVTYLDSEGDRHELDGDTPTNMNFFAFNSSIFNYLRVGFDEFLQEIKQTRDATKEFGLPQLVAQQSVEGVIGLKILNTEEKWFGVTNKEDRELVSKAIGELVKKGIYPEKLWD